MSFKEKSNEYFEFAKRKLDPQTRILSKVLNIFIFLVMIFTGSFLILNNHIQYGIDLYFAQALYMIFTKLEKMDMSG